MGESLTPLRVGMVGVGAISGQYFDTVARIASEVQLIAVADRDDERATAVAAERGIVARTVDDLFAAPDIDLILNLPYAFGSACDCSCSCSFLRRRFQLEDQQIFCPLIE